MANELILQNQALVPSDPAAIAAAESAKARIQSAYLIALHKPRNQDQARDSILKACRRPAFAEKVEYSRPVGGKAIKGPSIRFAEVALKEWGNTMTETMIVYEDDHVRRIKVFCTDLETNLTYSKEIVVEKTVERRNPDKTRETIGQRVNSTGETVYIVKATEDELHNKEAIAISKAVRNEGLRLIPSDIIDEGIEQARTTLKNRDSHDPATAKKRILDSFSDIGVQPKDIEVYLGHRTDTLTPAELQDLRSMYRAIREGEARWTDYVGGDRTPKDTESKKEILTKFEQLVAAKKPDMDQWTRFMELTAKGNRMSLEHLMAAASDRFDGLWTNFEAWQKKNPKKEAVKLEPAVVIDNCPDNPGIDVRVEYCRNECEKRQGCPAHE